MKKNIHDLIEKCLSGDRQAYGEIVEQYQGAVSAMAYSVTGDLAQSEDLAQEAFIVAWEKLGTLRKPESLSAWICGIAKNLARDWMRKQSRKPVVSLDSVAEQAQPAVDSAEEAQLRHERAEAVWTALAAIPETYREPLVLFYRQEHSIRGVAEILDLSEACIKKRLSRGRKMLRKEVAKLVEETLETSRPGKKFTAGVLAVLPPMHPHAGNAPGTEPAVITPASGLLSPIKLLVMSVVVMAVLGGFWGTNAVFNRNDSNLLEAHQSSVKPTTTAPATSENVNTALGTTEPESIALASGLIPAASDAWGAVSGTVFIQSTDQPAPEMRVLLGMHDGTRRSVVTNTSGEFSFQKVPSGENVVLAYDARYEELPEDWLRSEHIPVQLAPGEHKKDIRIEAPYSGGALTGRITDKATGAPLAGINVDVIIIGKSSPQSKSDQNGRYFIPGLEDGEYLVRIDRNNPILRSDSVDTMETIVIREGKTVTLDMAMDMGVPVCGKTVDQDGRPVPEATIDADLFQVSTRRSLDCCFKSDKQGRFTVWGANSGDRVVLSARKKSIASHIVVINPIPNETIDDTFLVLQPKTTVSGYFVDENGHAVKAALWLRYIHPDGSAGWHGPGMELSPRFTIDLAPGDYEMKGRIEGNNTGFLKQPGLPLHVGETPLSKVKITVKTKSKMTGDYILKGKVMDETGKPLKATRLYIDNRGSHQETWTDEAGRFLFNKLLNDFYRLHATPDEPFEKLCGYDRINPAETPEVTIVARLAGQLRGRVTDARTGETIKNFSAEYGERGFLNRESRWDRKNITSETGEFSLPARLDKDWYLRIFADGYRSKLEKGSALSSGEATNLMEFQLSPGWAVRGTVINEAGDSIAGALVYYDNKVFDIGYQKARYAAADTDVNGCFELSSFPDETNSLYILKKGYAIAHYALAPEMQVVLTAGGIIEGKIRINGMPPTGKVRVSAFDMVTHHHRWAKVDENEYYILTELMDADYMLELSVEKEGAIRSSYSSAEAIRVANGVTVTHDFEISSGTASVTGTLIHQGKPAGRCTVRCVAGGYGVSGSANEQGVYRFENLPAGPGSISVLLPDDEIPGRFKFHPILEFTLKEEKEISLDYDLGNLIPTN